MALRNRTNRATRVKAKAQRSGRGKAVKRPVKARVAAKARRGAGVKKAGSSYSAVKRSR